MQLATQSDEAPQPSDAQRQALARAAELLIRNVYTRTLRRQQDDAARNENERRKNRKS